MHLIMSLNLHNKHNHSESLQVSCRNIYIHIYIETKNLCLALSQIFLWLHSRDISVYQCLGFCLSSCQPQKLYSSWFKHILFHSSYIILQDLFKTALSMSSNDRFSKVELTVAIMHQEGFVHQFLQNLVMSNIISFLKTQYHNMSLAQKQKDLTVYVNDWCLNPFASIDDV